MNWPRIVRCTAAAIGIVFVIAVGALLAIRLLGAVW